MRRKIYTSDSFSSSFGRLIALATSGAYKAKTRWGLGQQALIKDVLRGVILPMRLFTSDTKPVSENAK